MSSVRSRPAPPFFTVLRDYLFGSEIVLVFVESILAFDLLFVIVRFVLSGFQSAGLLREDALEWPYPNFWYPALTAVGSDGASKLVKYIFLSCPFHRVASIMEAIKCNKGNRWMPWH
jgi:hypothetical protein